MQEPQFLQSMRNALRRITIYVQTEHSFCRSCFFWSVLAGLQRTRIKLSHICPHISSPPRNLPDGNVYFGERPMFRRCTLTQSSEWKKSRKNLPKIGALFGFPVDPTALHTRGLQSRSPQGLETKTNASFQMTYIVLAELFVFRPVRGSFSCQ
jgi:hypothetical protein